jgi:hypothetical protein
MKRPRTEKNGKLNIPSVEALSRRELNEWVYRRLHGDDARVASDPRDGSMPHYLLAIIYPKLTRQVREDIQDILLGFLTDLAKNPTSAWLGEAGDELLMLVDPVFILSPRRDDVVDILLQIASSVGLRTNHETNLHIRALQGLVTLRHRTKAQFAPP